MEEFEGGGGVGWVDVCIVSCIQSQIFRGSVPHILFSIVGANDVTIPAIHARLTLLTECQIGHFQKPYNLTNSLSIPS